MVRERSAKASGRRGFPAGQKFGERLRVGRRGQRVASRGRHGHDAVPSFGLFHHPADRRKPTRVQEPRGDAVGGHHQILDQRLRAVRLLGGQLAQRVAVKLRPRLQRHEVERAVLVAPAAEGLRHAVLQLQLHVHSRHGRRGSRQGTGACQPRADAVVGELRPVLDQRAVHVRCAQAAVGRDGELDDEGQAVLAGRKRREIGRQPLRQHREDDARGVDRRRVGGRVPIDRRALWLQGRPRLRSPRVP